MITVSLWLFLWHGRSPEGRMVHVCILLFSMCTNVIRWESHWHRHALRWNHLQIKTKGLYWNRFIIFIYFNSFLSSWAHLGAALSSPPAVDKVLHMVVSCDRPPQYKKWRFHEDKLLQFKLTLRPLSCLGWRGNGGWLLPWLKTRCPYRPSSGRTRSSHRGLGPSSELLLSADKQNCFKQALNSDEKGATDRSLVDEVSVGSVPEQPTVEMWQVSSASGSTSHVWNDKWNSSMQLTQQRFSAAQVVSAMNSCSADVLKKTSEFHLQSLVRSLSWADRPVHRADILLMLHQHQYQCFCSIILPLRKKMGSFL